ncbi:MAG: BamA/TamA family outer membrane protein [Polyangiaceae bacterium]|nr:BamA/TamA family outer membrane protein [Polyangiaceae bacterium]
MERPESHRRARRAPRSPQAVRRWLAALILLIGVLAASRPLAQPRPGGGGPSASASAAPVPEGVPRLTPRGDTELEGRPVRRYEIAVTGRRLREKAPPGLRRVRAGERFSPEVARRAIRELMDTGRYAEVVAEVAPEADGVVLRLRAVPRRRIAGVRIDGAPLDADDLEGASIARAGDEITEAEMDRLADRLRALHRRRGYPAATVKVDAIETDDEDLVVVAIFVSSGEPARVGRRTFVISPRGAASGVPAHEYAVASGDRADSSALEEADRALADELRRRGWHGATVQHELGAPVGVVQPLRVRVHAGLRVRIRFSGNRAFDSDQLEEALDLEGADDRSPASLAERVERFYLERGFLDVEVSTARRPGASPAEEVLALEVREGRRATVVSREYVCLGGSRTPAEVGSEIESFLSDLPGSGLLESVDPSVADATFGPGGVRGARPAPLRLDPYRTFVPELYERALEHLQALYRAEGYLSASVGPLIVVRRACDPRSPAGTCVPLGERRRPPVTCRFEGERPPDLEIDPAVQCVPDRARGITCEPDLLLQIPIRLGVQTLLWSVDFEGEGGACADPASPRTCAPVEAELAAAAALELGKPLSLEAVEDARRRLVDAHADRGFAFAEVESFLDLSPDRSRARVRFVVSPRERVIVSGFVVRGARRTNESLILSRVALEVGGAYERGLVRATEERLATLGTFASVTVGLEEPYVPAREKTVVITVVERLPQYLDVRPGFSTGEGFRVGFEYGHRNLGGEAIQLVLRVQLGYLPPPFVLESDVRRKYRELDVGERLERRNSATLELPDIGLGPLFRLSVEGVDVRDNARDFGLVKDAGIVTLGFRPSPRISAQLGGSLELNTAQIFGNREKSALSDYVEQNPTQAGAFRVPAGTTLAKAQRVGVTWDRRDNPLDARRGTLLALGVEHVRADPVGDTAGPVQGGTVDPFAPTTSQFLRFSGRVAGYIPVGRRGPAIALSLRGGYNHQLLTPCRALVLRQQRLGACSQTYPDRLFFLGGVDSLRGHPQDSVVPEDVARQLLDPGSGLRVEQVVIRGGDLFINPRLELRVPVGDSLATALFLDAGNLWRDPTRADPLDLRYAVGTGLRLVTPIGPLVFDYGFNLERVLGGLGVDVGPERTWEDLGAFHFSIGVL